MDAIFKEHGISVSAKALKRLELYIDLLIAQNEKVNLTAITDREQIILKHFLDSLMLSKFEDIGGKKLIDIGSGAGFPGLVLGVCESNLSVLLMDSRGKKVMFLEEVIDKLRLSTVKALHARAEAAAREPGLRESFDIATSRAVAKLSVLCEYALPYVKVGGVFAAYKGSEYREELEEAALAIEILGGKVERVESFKLAGGNELSRSLIFIRKLSEAPQKYPRKSNAIAKKPIMR